MRINAYNYMWGKPVDGWLKVMNATENGEYQNTYLC